MLDTPYLPGLALAYSTFVLGMFSPGPNVLTIMGTSMRSGRAAGKAVALGIGSGTFVWGTLTVTGLSALLAAYGSLVSVLKLVGAGYLLLLALRSFRAAHVPADLVNSSVGDTHGLGGYYRAGLALQLTNPKSILTWIAVASLAVEPNAPWWVSVALVAGTTAISLVGHTLYAVAFSAGSVVELYSRFKSGVDLALGAFYIFAAQRILASRSV